MGTLHKIAVLGGTGRTGQFVVQELNSRGYFVKALVKTTSPPESWKTDRIELIYGNACNPEIIRMLVKDSIAVISTIGQRQEEPLVAHKSTINILSAMKEHSISRFLAVAGINVDTPSDKKGPECQAATKWMSLHYPDIQSDRQKAYAALEASSAEWTLVRVPFIFFSDALGSISVDLEDCPGKNITAGDIAKFVASQVDQNGFVRRAPFIANSVHSNVSSENRRG